MLFAGIGNLSLDPRLMGDGEAQIALNVDLHSQGGVLQAVKANLVKIFATGTVHAMFRYKGRFLAHIGDSLYFGDIKTPYMFEASAAVRANFYGPANGGAPMSALSFNGICYLCNGLEFLKFDGSTFAIPFITAPSISGVTAVQGAAGDLEAGTYRYKLTWRVSATAALNGDMRDESPPSSSYVEVTIVADKTIDLASLPTQSGYVLVIYRWKKGTGEGWREVAELTAGAINYNDLLTYWVLGDFVKTENYETPPIPEVLSILNNNIFISGIKSWQNIDGTLLDNYLMHCDDFRPSGWSSDFLAMIGQTDYKLMNKLPLFDFLVVYTNATIWTISGLNTSEYQKEKANSTVGLAARLAVTDTVKHGHVILGSDRRLHIFNGYNLVENAALANIDGLLSKKSTHADRINWAAKAECRMSFHDDVVRFAYPSAGNIVANKVININFRNYPALTITISEYEVTSFFQDRVTHILYGGNSSGEIFEVEGDDTGVRLAPTYQTKRYDGGDIHALDTWQKLMLDYESVNQDITCEVFTDEVSTGSIILNRKSRANFDKPLDSLPSARGRQISFKFSWPATADAVKMYDYAAIVAKGNRR